MPPAPLLSVLLLLPLLLLQLLLVALLPLVLLRLLLVAGVGPCLCSMWLPLLHRCFRRCCFQGV
jgi:hypothetical protein